MTLMEQIYTQALVLIRDLEKRELPMLKLLCRSAEVSLTAKLRKGVTPEDCKADFVAAASLYALAALTELDGTDPAQQVTGTDLTERRKGADAASCCLRYQAELLISPYLKDEFVLLSV